MMSHPEPKFLDTPMDFWFTFLCILKKGRSSEYATIFRKKPPTFQKGMWRILEATNDAQTEKLMQKYDE